MIGHVRTALALALCAGLWCFAETAAAEGVALPAGMARYRVTFAPEVTDQEVVSRQLLAMCRCAPEPYAEVGFTGMMIRATPAAARLLSGDPRIGAIEEVRFDGAGPVTASSVETSAATESAPSPNVSTEADAPPWESGAYTYDGAGNITGIGTKQYVYDRLGRLASGGDPSNRQKYTYDPAGNLLSIKTYKSSSTPTSTRTLTVDSSTNRVLSATDTFTGATTNATYDSAGRLRSMPNASFEYDSTDMVTQATIEGVRMIHIYTASDERIATLKVNGSNVEQGADWTIRDLSGKVLRRFKKTTAPEQWKWDEDYIYRDGQLLAAEVWSQEKTRHFHLDHLGTPRLITGGGGAKASSRELHPFGEEILAAGTLPDNEPMKFTGHERDRDRVDYMHARYYAPEWGRFLSVDPGGDVDIHQPQSWNKYTYVRNNPINNVDPTGMCTNSIVCLNYGNVEGELTAANAAGTYVPAPEGTWEAAVENVAWGAQEYAWQVQDGQRLMAEMGASQALQETFPQMAIAFPLALGAVQGGAASVATEIQFAQKGVSATFRHGEFAGQTIDDVAAGLRSGAIHPNQLPVQTVVRNGATYTMNNRSLMALQQAGMRPTIIRNMTGNGFLEKQLTQRLAELGGPPRPGFVPFIRPPRP